MTTGRFALGLTGAPGAGKSTIAETLARALGAEAVLVPMDGFHLHQSELDRLGRSDRKGAPDTFDVEAYVSLLERLRAEPDGVVRAPAFDRVREDPVPDAIAILPSHRIVITEGNYLLVESGGWERVRPLLDACWFVAADEVLRVERLISRHVEFGRSPAEAQEWVMRSDEANARLVDGTRGRADRIVLVDEPISALAREVRNVAGQTR